MDTRACLEYETLSLNNFDQWPTTCLKGLMSFKGKIPYNKPSLTTDYKYSLLDHFQIAMLVMSPPLFMSEEGHWVGGSSQAWVETVF